MENIIIQLDYNIQKPIPITDFTQALEAFNSQINRHLRGQEFYKNKDITLEIISIESGSIKSKIAAVITGGLIAIGHYNIVFDAIKNVTATMTFLARETPSAPVALEKQDLEDVKSIVRPVVKEPGSNIYIVASGNATVNVEFNASWQKANVIDAQAREEIKRLNAPVKRHFERVVLMLEEAVNKTKKNVGDKGIVGDIYPEPVKLIFPNPSIKETILENPFRRAYIVNAEAVLVQGVPAFYKITALHETRDRDFR